MSEIEAQNLAGLRIKDRYVLLEEIGSGLMARAYLAYDELLEGEVVVKVFNTEIAGVAIPLGPDWAQEAKRAMKVRGCPCIASVTDFGEEPHAIEGVNHVIPYIVWEHVQGLTLLEYFDKKLPVDERMILETALQLLQTLIALKKSNLIHGDLHIKNIMYDRNATFSNRVKVIDFGLANLIKSEKDFKRDGICSGKIINQVLDEYRNQVSEPNVPFVTEIEKLSNELARSEPPSIEELNDLYDHAEELERKFTLKLGLFQGRRKNVPAGLKILPELKSETVDNILPYASYWQVGRFYSWFKDGLESGKGRMLAIQGETGLGKTRFARELLYKLASENPNLYVMRSALSPNDNTHPFKPVNRLLRSFLGENETENYRNFLEEMFSGIPMLVQPLVEFINSQKNNSSQPQSIDIEYPIKLMATAFKQLALKHGLVILLDDFEHADEQTIALIRELVTTLDRYPLLLLLAFSPSFDTGRITPTGNDSKKATDYLIHEIKELDQGSFRELILKRYSWEYPGEASRLAEMLYPKIGGNPLYLMEMFEFLETHNLLIKNAGSVALDPDFESKEIGIPESVQSTILEKALALPEDEKAIVESAAILGSEFNLEHLASLIGQTLPKTEESIRHLAENHRLFLKMDDKYIFNPLNIWEVIYSSTPEKIRREMHIKAAEILKARVHLDPKLNALIATHLSKAQVMDNVPSYYLKAAVNASRNNQKSQMDQWINAGMSELEKMPNPSKHLFAEFHLLKGLSAKQDGDNAKYIGNLNKAFSYASSCGDKKLECKTLKALGEYHRSVNDFQSSIIEYKNAIQISRRLGEERNTALILKELGTNYCFTGDFENALKVLDESRLISEELDDRESMARINNNIGLVHKMIGAIDEAKDWFERSISLFTEIGDIQGMIFPVGNMAIILTSEGEFEKAMNLLGEIISAEEKLGDGLIKAKVHVVIGDVLNELGDFDGAMSYYERALIVFRAFSDAHGECETLTSMALACLDFGKDGLARNYSDIAFDIKKRKGYTYGLPYNYLIESRILHQSGDLESARKALSIGLKILKYPVKTQLDLELLLENAKLAATEGKMDEALECYASLAQHLEKKQQLVSPVFLAKFYHSRGKCMNRLLPDSPGNQDITKSNEILKSLWKNISQDKWKNKFFQKYSNFFTANQSR